MLCSKTWINGKPFFMLLQCGVNEKTKHAVSLGKKHALCISNADLSTVENTVNTKVVSLRTLFYLICITLTFCRLFKQRLSVNCRNSDCSVFAQLLDSTSLDSCLQRVGFWEITCLCPCSSRMGKYSALK